MNRGGVHPQPDTVQNLGLKLLEVGFGEDEANHEGVCVREAHDEARRRDLVASDKSYETYTQFNITNCQHSALSTCFMPGGVDVKYGTLSHSHLLLVLLCLSTQAERKMPEKVQSTSTQLRRWTDSWLHYATMDWK